MEVLDTQQSSATPMDSGTHLKEETSFSNVVISQSLEEFARANSISYNSADEIKHITDVVYPKLLEFTFTLSSDEDEQINQGMDVD